MIPGFKVILNNLNLLTSQFHLIAYIHAVWCVANGREVPATIDNFVFQDPKKGGSGACPALAFCFAVQCGNNVVISGLLKFLLKLALKWIWR